MLSRRPPDKFHPSFGNLRPVHYLLGISNKICPPVGDECTTFASKLLSAGYIDIDFDTISQALVLNVFHQKSADPEGWTDQITNGGTTGKFEVGVLANEPPTEPEELKLGGFLAVLGEDDKPTPTLFSFPARHHSVSKLSISSYLASFLFPTGLHPTLRLTFPTAELEPPSENCALHSYLTLASTLFPDKYQLSSPLFLASKNLRSLRSVAGETDLEAPDWAIEKWGSAMLVELATPQAGSSPKQGSWHADIPLHLRYLSPSVSGVAATEIPWPVVFWACRAEKGTKMSVNPFDRVNLGYDGLFGPKTMFYHLSPNNRSATLVETLSVPVLQTYRASWIKPGTVAVVLLGFCWVLWKLLLLALGQSKTKLYHGKKTQ
ncbi:protease B nonderepressible form [Trapelia coarctata]|nr:protease B nonderepressible form [Trapelia coarctata]